jgi:hypothetical protein
LPASWLSQPSLAGKARRQVSFLSEAVIEKRRSSANLVHQVLRSSFDSRETMSVVTHSWLKPVIINAGTQSRAQPVTENTANMQSATAVKQQLRSGRAVRFHLRMIELTIVVVEVEMPLMKGNIRNCCLQALDRNSKSYHGVPRI